MTCDSNQAHNVVKMDYGNDTAKTRTFSGMNSLFAPINLSQDISLPTQRDVTPDSPGVASLSTQPDHHFSIGANAADWNSPSFKTRKTTGEEASDIDTPTAKRILKRAAIQGRNLTISGIIQESGTPPYFAALYNVRSSNAPRPPGTPDSMTVRSALFGIPREHEPIGETRDQPSDPPAPEPDPPAPEPIGVTENPPAPVDKFEVAMSVVYECFHTNLSKNFDHIPGGGTHLELTTNGMDIINSHLREAGAFDIPRLQMTDYGSGYNTYLERTGQQYEGNYIGYELERDRCVAQARAKKDLLSSDKGDLLTNYRVSMKHMDINDLEEVDTDVGYSFDEAFTNDTWFKLISLVIASRRIQFFVTFKAAKYMEGRSEKRKLLEQTFDVVWEGSVPNKGGSNSQVIIFKRDPNYVTPVPTEEKPWPPNTKEHALADSESLLAASSQDQHDFLKSR